jgi:succinate dehydrogenase / fumarate reductase flavoprotein subunit
MRIYPAPHYTMGGLWVDYNLMSNVPGLFVLGEANFSDHGANRLGASALMQGLADGYFVLPYTIGQFFASLGIEKDRPTIDHDACKQALNAVKSQTKRLVSMRGKKTAVDYHREAGRLLWENCGMSRTKKSLEEAIEKIGAIRSEFQENLMVPGYEENLNVALERAGRVADFLEFGDLMARDALTREESCGGHFREEYQYPDGEAKRNDEDFCHVATWEYHGDKEPLRHVEPLKWETVHPTVRSYK